MVDPLSEVLAALADPTRRNIVTRLATADATVGELAEPYDMSMQAISKHLKCWRRRVWSPRQLTPSAGRCILKRRFST